MSPSARRLATAGGRSTWAHGAEHSIAVARIRPWQGGTLYVLAACPFAADDHGTDAAAYVIQHATFPS